MLKSPDFKIQLDYLTKFVCVCVCVCVCVQEYTIMTT